MQVDIFKRLVLSGQQSKILIYSAYYYRKQGTSPKSHLRCLNQGFFGIFARIIISTRNWLSNLLLINFLLIDSLINQLIVLALSSIAELLKVSQIFATISPVKFLLIFIFKFMKAHMCCSFMMCASFSLGRPFLWGTKRVFRTTGECEFVGSLHVRAHFLSLELVFIDLHLWYQRMILPSVGTERGWEPLSGS